LIHGKATREVLGEMAGGTFPQAVAVRPRPRGR
jgi:hypothetical protein